MQYFSKQAKEETKQLTKPTTEGASFEQHFNSCNLLELQNPSMRSGSLCLVDALPSTEGWQQFNAAVHHHHLV